MVMGTLRTVAPIVIFAGVLRVVLLYRLRALVNDNFAALNKRDCTMTDHSLNSF
jgi:hypothetical protein